MSFDLPNISDSSKLSLMRTSMSLSNTKIIQEMLKLNESGNHHRKDSTYYFFDLFLSYLKTIIDTFSLYRK